MAHWKKSFTTRLELGGATTVITLKPSEYGWELRGWRYTLGGSKAGPEGNPFMLDNFAEFNEAYDAFTEISVEALNAPFVYEEQPQRMVSARDQQAIHESARSDHPIEPEYAS